MKIFLANLFELIENSSWLQASQHLLEHKHQVYKKLSGGLGICWFGAEGSFNAMVLNCLGQSLEELFTCCHFKFTMQTILVLRLLTKQLVGIPSLKSIMDLLIYSPSSVT
jgi:hypothetical protein